MGKIYKIVLSGGPGGGKSTSMSRIEQTLSARGYKVLIIPESATELIINGIIPCDKLSLDTFQEIVLDKQLSKETLYDKISSYYNEDIIILLDRGIPDQLAYISKEKFEQMLEKRNLDLSKATDRYDLVLHLVTAADGASENYEWAGGTKCNNKARSESPIEAIEKDKMTLNGWMLAGCKKLKVIDNSSDFNNKIDRVLSEVFNLIGEPIPYQTERKFLIKKPSINILENLNLSSKSEIIQTYLTPINPEIERRVRQRGNIKDGYTFYYTEKSDITEGERKEVEKRISTREYINLISEADFTLHQIKKYRYCFIDNNQFFELDIYPFSDEYAILEIELKNMSDKIQLPTFLEIIKEVTNDLNYRNISLAKTLSFNFDKI